ncbi:hypothetical protein OAG46_00110 [Planctomycetota bacterium]|nr:hypothetical protein [Planctomycetota bacterium]|tara:strand:+ start:25 stop:801 length:777 start_codon:yes stop_codon:yes gene_type:complete
METKEKKKPQVKKDTWEVKDRYYHLLNGQSPLTTRINSKHSSRKPLMWFDEEKQYNRELRYATNMKSPFMDEQKGTATLGHIVFENGVLMVPREKQALQKLLSLYHPNRNKIYAERDEVIEASNELDNLELQVEAMAMAINMDVDKAEAILRVELGSGVSKMSSKELKRDLLLFAKGNPELFLELVNDENVELRNFGIRAVEAGIVSLAQDQRTFTWASNGRKLMNVPFDENPYSAMAAWFKTDEGVEVYKSIEKKFK